MNQVRVFILSCAIALALTPGLAFAQPPSSFSESRWYANFDVGAQIKSQTFTAPGSFPIYGEDATVSSTFKSKTGTMINLEAGTHVSRSFFLGAAYTYRFATTGSASVDVSVPHPLFTNTFRSASGTVTGLKQSEYGVHISAGWRLAATSRIDVRFFGGPSFFHLSQDLVDTVTIEETGPPYTTVSVTGGTVTRISKGGAGFHVGLDGAYRLTDRYGVGMLIRYSHGSVDVATGDNPKVSVDVGGFEIGGGVRVRF
jgi:hypothetical protein